MSAARSGNVPTVTMRRIGERWRPAIERIESCLPVLVVGAAWVFAFRRLDDFDTWWHLAAGRWIAQHLTVPQIDPISYTSGDREWINLQWLYELGIYGLYRIGGIDLVITVTAFGYAATIALLLRNLRASLGPLSAAVIAVWVTLIAQERFSVRPEMMSFLLLQVEFWILSATRSERRGRLWLLPLALLLWVNTHQLFVIGIVVICCRLAGDLLSQWLTRRVSGGETSAQQSVARILLPSAVAATLITFANPYGLTGILYPVKLFVAVNGSTPALRVIGELRTPFSGYFPTFAVTAYQLFFIFSVAVVATAVPLTMRSRRADARSGIDPGELLLFVGFAYLSVVARRNMALFALGTAPFVARSLRIVTENFPIVLRQQVRIVSKAAAVVAAPALVVLGWFVVTNGFYRLNGATQEFGAGVMDVHFPIRASAFAREARLPPRLYNDVASGGYLAWAAPIEGGPYIDGRLGLSTDFFATFLQTFDRPPLWQAEADRVGINTVLLSYRWDNRHVLIRWLLSDSRWALVYFDDVAVMFVRRAGNDDVIQAANDLFETYNQQLLTRLVAPATTTWQWPIGRAQELWNYGTVLDLMGLRDVAAGIYARLLTLRLPADEEAEIELRLAVYHVERGDRTAAHTHWARAAQVDPHNPALAAVQERIRD